MNTNKKYMQKAIDLAKRGIGKVSPNPLVGAVIVKNNEIIAEGWHKHYGGDHAEVDAVKNAEIEDFSDCTIYVNLEPCSHHGKTPPCADMLIEKNFKKVVIGMKDPNHLVAGNGINKLLNANVDVETEVLENEAKDLNKVFIKHITTGSPYVIVKVAQTIDGKIALNDYSSKWITGAESRKLTHKLRSEVSAVLVGKNTVLQDNPKLNVRDAEGHNPHRIILDSQLSLSENLNVFTDNDKENTIIFCDLTAKEMDKFKKIGINVIPVKSINNQLDLNEILSQLGKLNITSILVEGGAGIFSSFVKNGLIDELHIFSAPKIVGKGIGSFDKIEIDSLNNAYQFKLKEFEQVGEDMHMVYIKK